MDRGCRRYCMPKCHKKCIGEFTEKYKVYETCCREIVKVCPRCGCEYEVHMYPMCPRCGGMHMGMMGYPGKAMYMDYHHGEHMMSDEMY